MNLKKYVVDSQYYCVFAQKNINQIGYILLKLFDLPHDNYLFILYSQRRIYKELHEEKTHFFIKFAYLLTEIYTIQDDPKI